MERYILAVLVRNQFGVLNRVTSMFRRRQFNISALTVSETESNEFSRITVTFTGDKAEKNQLVRQLAKLYDVKEIEVLDKAESVSRELLLIKVANKPETRQDIMSAVEVFRCKIIDYSAVALICEVTGESNKIQAFIELMKPYGIIEMCRTGMVALERGNNCLKSE